MVPRDDINLIVAIFMVTVFPGLLAVTVRAFVRIYYDGREKPFIIAADVLIALSFVASVEYCSGMSMIVIFGLISVGRGRDANAVFIDNGTTVKALKIGWATGNTYYLGLYTAKGAVIALLYGIIPDSRRLHRLFLYLVTGIIAVCGSYTILVNLFGCYPIRHNWTLGPENCYAYRQVKILASSSALQIFTDLILIALPLPLIYRLRITSRQKLGLAFIFSLGFSCVVATVVRLILVYGPKHQTSDGYSLILSGVELSTGICVACAPAVRTFIARRKGLRVDGCWRNRKSRENRTTTGVAELDRMPYGLLELRPGGGSESVKLSEQQSGSQSTRKTHDGEEGSTV